MSVIITTTMKLIAVEKLIPKLKRNYVRTTNWACGGFLLMEPSLCKCISQNNTSVNMTLFQQHWVSPLAQGLFTVHFIFVLGIFFFYTFTIPQVLSLAICDQILTFPEI